MVVLGRPKLLPSEYFLTASFLSLRSIIVLVAAHLSTSPHAVKDIFSTIGTGLVRDIYVDPRLSVPVSSYLPNHLGVTDGVEVRLDLVSTPQHQAHHKRSKEMECNIRKRQALSLLGS